MKMRKKFKPSLATIHEEREFFINLKSLRSSLSTILETEDNVISTYDKYGNDDIKINKIRSVNGVTELKKQGIDVVVAFSGKENDNRNPEYFPGLKQVVEENDLTENIKFLGFLDREVQLQLMNHSKAIIQPSLFEGWSTVIEDAMAMNQTIIASDLEVNKEQLGESGIYFDRLNSKELVNILKDFKPLKIKYDYPSKLNEFATQFYNILN
jgi:glycosyltransferase involved in cell wall biosynthesis